MFGLAESPPLRDVWWCRAAIKISNHPFTEPYTEIEVKPQSVGNYCSYLFIFIYLCIIEN